MRPSEPAAVPRVQTEGRWISIEPSDVYGGDIEVSVNLEMEGAERGPRFEHLGLWDTNHFFIIPSFQLRAGGCFFIAPSPIYYSCNYRYDFTAREFLQSLADSQRVTN